MGIIYKTEERRVIPRWRSYKLTNVTGELNGHIPIISPLNFNPNELLSEQIKTWRNNKSLSHAGDLLSGAYVLGHHKRFEEIARFILDKCNEQNTPLVRLAKETLNIPTENAPSHLDQLFDIKQEDYFTEIRKLKHILNKEPKNPIAWIELGRYYSLLDQIDKAQQCIKTALHLDPNNRFIVRSASRFYHHFSEDKEKALFVVKKSAFLKSDPWMIAAEIAYSSVLGRFSKLVKVGLEYLKYNNRHPSSITELASALGTYEFNHGNSKDAKKLINQSLLLPNDNSLAQSNWIGEKINGIIIDNKNYELPLAFEANAQHNYELGNFQNAFDLAIRWHNDEPYLTRPIKMASYISSIFLKEHKKSIELIEALQKKGSVDNSLKNNLIYFLIKDNQIEKATAIFEAELRPIVETEQKDKNLVEFIATAGLIAYKLNQPEFGKKYYEKAITIAKNNKNNYAIASATANYVREAIAFAKSTQELTELSEQLHKACKNIKEADIKEMYKEASIILSAKLEKEVF